MLAAGLFKCILGFLQGLSPFDFTVQLLIVLIIFYLIGTVIKWFYMANFQEEESEETTYEEASEEGAEGEEGEEATAEKESEKETDAGEN